MTYAEKVPWSKILVLGRPVWQWTLGGSLVLGIGVTPVWYSTWSKKLRDYHQPYPVQPKEVQESQEALEDLGSYQRVHRQQAHYSNNSNNAISKGKVKITEVNQDSTSQLPSSSMMSAVIKH